MPTYVGVGSVCWDVVEGEGRPRLGGSVLFSSRVALAQGWHARIVTSGTAELEEAVTEALPEVEVVVQRSATDTVMAFGRDAEQGPRSVPTRAAPIDVSGPDLLGGADVVHLAPIMGEVTRELVGALGDRPFVGITPQGLLRAVDAQTHRLVQRAHLDPWWAAHVDAAVLSEHEYALVADPTTLRDVPLAVTRGHRGCIGRNGDVVVEVPGVEVGHVSPVGTIGAGDVFAAAYFLALASGTAFEPALALANRTAAAHVAGVPLQT